MYLLYVDESGDVENPADHFVVGALAIHESRVRSLNHSLDAIAAHVQRWRTSETRFARLGRLVEVPLFIDSRATRLTQAADFVAHGVYRYYEARDDSLFVPMLNASTQLMALGTASFISSATTGSARAPLASAES